uniref:Reverse transcriptase domain-containing protein n=1 Tax=Tanacetum cinerariifolium TaxID=118510 RepID=A0A6L2L3V7_TANCI|nr:reverse transcriptase domain-containing protein [Tanacetum cinerariifolium]
MADQRTMTELLRVPTEGYAEAIVVPLILAEQFELKHSLINMMTSDQFFRLEKDNPHDHICWFNKITSTIKYKDVPNSAIKLMLFSFSLTGAARRWLEKEPPRSIHTWEDLVSKFINEFFPTSRTTNLRDEISNFQQRFVESFHEAWDRYKDLLRACPHHGFTELHQLDTFYNALNPADQDSLNAAEIAKLTIAVNQQTSAVTTAMTAILRQFQATPPLAFVKAVKEICFTCGGAHPYYQCLAASGNTFPELKDNIQGYVSAAAVNYNQGNFVYRPPGSGSLPSNTVANPKGELKSITTRSGLIFDGPTVPTPPPFINPDEDERVEETLTDPNLFEYTIKVPPPPVQKYKPSSQRDYILHVNITLADALILMPKYQKMLKALLSNKEKLQELANTPLNENCSAVILKKLLEKLGDPGKFLIPCGFSLPELISNRMTLELANRAIYTPAGIARDVFVSVGKFTFLADFVIVDYESDPRVPFILGRPFLRTARALIDIHGEEMIFCDGDERLTLNMRHDTSRYSNQPQKESINLINVFNDSSKYFLEGLFSNQPSGNPNFSDFVDELAIITFPSKYDDDLQFDVESDLKEIEFLLHQDIDSSLKDSIDQKVEFDAEKVYDDPFDSKGEKIKESKLLIDELDLPCDFLLPSEYDSFISQDFSRVDALPSTNNEDKVFNPCILIQENPFEITTRVVQDKSWPHLMLL